MEGKRKMEWVSKAAGKRKRGQMKARKTLQKV
jgi:hypothetical protein